MESNTTLTLGSLFDGSGGFPLGGLLCGITPVWASEIEPFPIRVTTKRLPFMKHYGDISQMDGGKIEPVDIITFGSPCTDMSIAGRRAGLDGKQSVLFYQAIRIIQEMRDATHGKYPRYIVWENVPGAFSSNHGEDFKAVLEAVIGIKEPGAQVPMPEKNLWPYADLYMGEQWSVAYRTLDAQHWGVPQRRRRIFLVADFAGWGAGQVLFESEGLSGYSAEGFRAWQRAARDPAAGSGAAGVCLNDQGGSCMDVSSEVAATLRAEHHGHPPCVLDAAGFCTEHSADSRGIGFEPERAPTLRAGVVPAAIALESHPIDSRIKIADDGTIQTLTSRMGTGGMNRACGLWHLLRPVQGHALQQSPRRHLQSPDIPHPGYRGWKPRLQSRRDCRGLRYDHRKLCPGRKRNFSYTHGTGLQRPHRCEQRLHRAAADSH